MDPDLTRLCRIPGNDDLTTADVAEILQVSTMSVQRAVNSGALEAKRHKGRSAGHRSAIRIPRAAVVAYLISITTGSKAALLASIAEQCPQWMPSASPQPPTNRAIQFLSSTRHRRTGPSDPYAGHPDLFAVHTA